jgi:hypothetical protein
MPQVGREPIVKIQETGRGNRMITKRKETGEEREKEA